MQTNSVCSMYVGDQFVGVDCFLSTPSVLLFLGVFFVFF